MKNIAKFSPVEKRYDSSLRGFFPQSITVPFASDVFSEGECLVKVGDFVSEGQLIGWCGKGESKIGVHSPVPGTVTELKTVVLSDGNKGKGAVIAIGGTFSFVGKKQEKQNWSFYESKYLLDIFSENGVVNTFTGCQSLSSQIKKLIERNDRILVVRLFDAEPSVQIDSYLSSHNLTEVSEGARIIAKAYRTSEIVFVCSKDSIPEINRESMLGYDYEIFATDTGKYPAGYKENIIRNARKDKVFSKGFSQKKINHHSLFVDPSTCINAYNAVVNGTPAIEQYVEVSGECLNSAGILKARVGTSFSYLAESCGGFKNSVGKIIVNGMVSGYEAVSSDTPLSRSVKSVMFVPSEDLHNQEYSPCIGCGKCRAVCPEKLFPDLIFRTIMNDRKLSREMIAMTQLCFECNLCNAVCTSRIPLSQTIKMMKDQNEVKNEE